MTFSPNNPTLLRPATKNRYKSMISTAFTEAHAKGPAVVIPKLPSWDENNFKERYLDPAEEEVILPRFAVAHARNDNAGRGASGHSSSSCWTPVCGPLRHWSP